MLDVSPVAVAAKGFRYGGLVPHGSLNTKENVSLTPFASAWKDLMRSDGCRVLQGGPVHPQSGGSEVRAEAEDKHVQDS